MVIKLSGTNGSGKSSLIRAVMAIWNFRPVQEESNKRPSRYVATIRPGDRLHGKLSQVVVLGPYETACGGMDAVGDHGRRMTMIESVMDRSKTLALFESVLDGTTYGAIGELSERSKTPWIYAVMDTPYEECVRRVEARRKLKGNMAPFDGEKSLRPKIKACLRAVERAAEEGHYTYKVDYRDTPAKAAKKLVDYVEGLWGGKQ